MYLNKKLKFKRYVKIKAVKALKIFNYIKAFLTIVKGFFIVRLYKIIKIILLLVLLYNNKV